VYKCSLFLGGQMQFPTVLWHIHTYCMIVRTRHFKSQHILLTAHRQSLHPPQWNVLIAQLAFKDTEINKKLKKHRILQNFGPKQWCILKNIVKSLKNKSNLVSLISKLSKVRLESAEEILEQAKIIVNRNGNYLQVESFM
jgi:hypothetical protein